MCANLFKHVKRFTESQLGRSTTLIKQHSRGVSYFQSSVYTTKAVAPQQIVS